MAFYDKAAFSDPVMVFESDPTEVHFAQKVYYSMAEISEERRNGYSWYGDWPAKLLKEDYLKWKSAR